MIHRLFNPSPTGSLILAQGNALIFIHKSGLGNLLGQRFSCPVGTFHVSRGIYPTELDP
jgi:hypothetical protein